MGEFNVFYFHSRVMEDIESWPPDTLADYLRLIELLISHGPDLRLPWSRPMGQGLFELRPRGQTVTGRALYCFSAGRTIVILHAFAKKTRQTPDHDIRLARARMKEWNRD